MPDAERTETPEPTQPPEKTHRRFWKKKRWWFLLVLILGLIWFNGPGWQWIATRVAHRYLSDLGLEGSFDLTGRLSSGQVGVEKLELEGDTTVTLAGLDRANVSYEFGDLLKGRIDGLEVDGLHVDIDLDTPGKEEKPKDGATDPIALLQTLYKRLGPMELNLTDASLNIHRGDQPVVKLAPSDLIHQASTPGFQLSLGEMSLPKDQSVPAQETEVTWTEDSIAVEQLELLPGVSVQDLTAHYPEGEPTRFEAAVVIDESRIDLRGDLNQATASFSGEPLSIPNTLARFNLELPVEGSVTDLEATVSNLDAGFENLDAELVLAARGLSYDDWSSESLELTASLREHELTAELDGTALGSPANLRLQATLSPDVAWPPVNALATLTLDEAVPAIDFVRRRYSLAPEAPSPPPSSITASAKAGFENGRLTDASGVMDVVARGDSPPLHLEVGWAPQEPLDATLRVPGAELEAVLDFEERTYEGGLTTEALQPDQLNPWLIPFGIEVPAGMQGTLAWSGSGSFAPQPHSGQLDVESFTWNRQPTEKPIQIFTGLTYDWPSSMQVTSLNVQQGAQKIETRARLTEHRLELEELSWSDGTDTLLNGRASIPVPGSPTDWKAILRSHEDVSIDITSTELPFAKLHPFLPDDIRFPETSQGKLAVTLTGSPADPLLEASFTGTDVKLDRFSDAPPVDVELDATGREQTLKLEGELRAPGYPPAVIDAVTHWTPEQWAEDPETVRQAPLDASLRVENLNLNLFRDLVPKARRLEGEVNIRAEATGTLGEPQPLATVTLSGGRFETSDPSIPRVRDAALHLTATPQKLELEKLTAMVSGGSLDASGSVDLIEGSLSNLNFELDGRGLPAVRNESMIIRFNADLALRGDWENATLAGQIGVIDSLFHKDVEILPLGGPVRTVAEPELASIDAAKPADFTASIPQPFHDWRLDLTARTANPFLIRGNLAGGEAYLDARITGTLGAPRPDGRVTLREVTAKLPFSTLNIDTGQIVLRPDHPFDPLLDLKGHSSVRPYEIDIYVYGPISDPQIQPTSNPPLPESEIYTLLASGATTEGIEDTDAATARAAQLLIEEFRRGRLGNLPGFKPLFKMLDRVDFQVGERDPYSSRKYNSVAFELDDNWLLTAGISEQGNTRSKLTYLFRFR